MEKRLLGRSGLQVSVLGLGCWALAGGEGWGDQDEHTAIATIHAALDCGINLLDTAEGYGAGKSEEIVGLALADRRARALIATKISPHHADPAGLRHYLEASLRRLQTDYVDIYMLHWPLANQPIDETLAALQALKQEGKIRAIGLSNFGPQQFGEALRTGVSIDAHQLCYNLISRGIEYEVLPLCRQHQVGVLTYMPLMQGLLSGRWRTADEVPPFRARTRHFSSARPGARHGEPGAEAETFAALDEIRQIAAETDRPMSELALAWVAAQQGVTSVLAGGRSPEQVTQNAQAMAEPLPDEVIARLDRATQALKLELGAQIDYWQNAEHSRSR